MNDAELEQAVREAGWLEMDKVWAKGNKFEGLGLQDLGGSKGHKGLGFRAGFQSCTVQLLNKSCE